MVKSCCLTLVALTSISLFVVGAAALAGEPENSRNDSTEPQTNLLAIVNQALEAEAAGDLDQREKLLNQVIDQEDSAPARWHSGYLSKGKKAFETVEESVQSNAENLKISKYRQQRKKLVETAAGHWEMAQWCAKNKLMPQARAHLNRVIDFNPEHAAARAALGFVRMGNEWVSPEEMEMLSKRAAAKSASIQKYGKQVSKLIEQMNSSRPIVRERAVASLMELDDPDAVGAVENGLASPAVQPSKLAIDWMSQIDTVESSLILTRYSLLHPQDEIRQYATSKLVGRPLHDFVPELLEMLSSPIRTSVVPAYDRNGVLLGYKQSFAKEGFENKDVAVLTRVNLLQSRTINRTDLSLRNRNGREFGRLLQRAENQRVIAQLQEEAEREVAARLETVNRENQEIQKRNQAIGRLIAYVSEQPFTDKAEDIWNWWDEYNETGYQQYKPERYTSTGYTTTTVVNDYNISCECFVAGTQVMTELGLRSIESIVAGDRILSRDLSTGELVWKPVLQRTFRPASATVKIATDQELFHCTGGHLFWVSGEGWKKASELNKGDVLHGAEKPSLVVEVRTDIPLETFNLRIADHCNYFVGDALVMTHDVTPRLPNRQKVPGQELLKSMVRK